VLGLGVSDVYGMGRPENAIDRVRSALKECLSAGEVLRTIDEFFDDLGFEFDPQAEESSLARGIGQRRSRAAGYLDSIDLADASGRNQLFSAVATKLTEWGDREGWDPLQKLLRTMKAAGYEWDGSHIVERSKPSSGQGNSATITGPAAAAPAQQAKSEAAGPRVFISYAHEDQSLATELASALRSRDCHVWIDQDGMRVGDHLIDRIAEAISTVDFLLAIISAASVGSPWCQRELSMAMSDELERAEIRVLPIRVGDVALPITLRDVYSPILDPVLVPAMVDKLIRDMASHRERQSRRSAPTPTPTSVPTAPTPPPVAAVDEPIRILGVDEANVGRPGTDGARGSALYRVPLRLNRQPSPLWATIFPQVWDHPPRFTTMHRPGIASVSGDSVVLDGTTVDELERYHAETLRLVIPEVNRRVTEIEDQERQKAEQAEADWRAHEAAVREAARRISFD
jgi:hypothetical protein